MQIHRQISIKIVKKYSNKGLQAINHALKWGRDIKKVCVIMIRPVNALAPKVFFKGQFSDYENPVSRKAERRLALLNAGGISAVLGAVTTAITRSYTSSWKSASLFGIGAGIISMLFLAPKFLYKSGIDAYAKQKEMDVFTREKEKKKKLLVDVNEAIDGHSTDLGTKLENYSKSVARKLAS